MAGIREFFAQRGLEMPERNAKQAWVIPCAEVLPNPVGTAPGWLARIGERWSWPCLACRAKCSACGGSKRCRAFRRA